MRLGLIELTLVGEAATWGFWESWMLDAHRRQSGRLLFFQNEDQKAKTVVFYDAFCVHYTCRFNARGQDGQGSFEVELNLSAAAKKLFELVENHTKTVMLSLSKYLYCFVEQP